MRVPAMNTSSTRTITRAIHPPRLRGGEEEAGLSAASGAFRGGGSGICVSSATLTPNSRARASRFSMSGAAAPVSHLLTAWRLTPSRAPSSSWEMPRVLRYALIRCPSVMDTFLLCLWVQHSRIPGKWLPPGCQISVAAGKKAASAGKTGGEEARVESLSSTPFANTEK